MIAADSLSFHSTDCSALADVDLEARRNSPYNEVVVLVVDQARDAAIRVVLGVRGRLVFLLAEVDVMELKWNLFLMEHDRDALCTRGPGTTVKLQHHFISVFL